ncbi:MAG: mechanosensitive ion channel [Chloroflexi bacterium]|nr:mechanosensitive ion channel [Chloroflexota bacterium]
MNDFINFIIPWLLAHGIKVVFIVIVAFTIILIGSKTLEKLIRRAVPPDGLDPDAERKREDTLIRIFVTALRVIVWSITLMMILPEFGVNIAPILAGAGVLGLAIGFGTQNVVRDFLAGLFVIIENQYRVEDYISLDGVSGTVEDITLRKTVLRDLHGTVHHITHGSVTNVANYTNKLGTARMSVSVAYKEDLDHVMAVINSVGKKWRKSRPGKRTPLPPSRLWEPAPATLPIPALT